MAEVLIAGDEDFGARLKDMRLWLDEHRFEPSTFTYVDLNPGMGIQVSFKIGNEAELFAKRFGGSLTNCADAQFLAHKDEWQARLTQNS